MIKEIVVCDLCERSPDGNSPDFVYALECGAVICDECMEDHKENCKICSGE